MWNLVHVLNNYTKFEFDDRKLSRNISFNFNRLIPLWPRNKVNITANGRSDVYCLQENPNIIVIKVCAMASWPNTDYIYIHFFPISKNQTKNQTKKQNEKIFTLLKTNTEKWLYYYYTPNRILQYHPSKQQISTVPPSTLPYGLPHCSLWQTCFPSWGQWWRR